MGLGLLEDIYITMFTGKARVVSILEFGASESILAEGSNKPDDLSPDRPQEKEGWLANVVVHGAMQG